MTPVSRPFSVLKRSFGLMRLKSRNRLMKITSPVLSKEADFQYLQPFLLLDTW